MSHEMIVAAVTPLADAGARLDEEAIPPMVAFLEGHGADGLFVCGTTGEGVLLSLEERRRAAVAFRSAHRGRLIVHCGAQTTADTVELAAHAREAGADAVGVIPPPYYRARPRRADGAFRLGRGGLRPAAALPLRLHRAAAATRCRSMSCARSRAGSTTSAA